MKFFNDTFMKSGTPSRDFLCKHGTYEIPAATVILKNEKIYSFDINLKVLRK